MVYCLKALLLAVLLAALGFALQATYWQGKAQLAQWLIAAAWQRGDSSPPWPWADTWPVARLQVPALGVDQYVMHGVSGQALAFGPGWLPLADPLGGDTSIVLAGHRDSHFAFLQALAPGQEIVLQHHAMPQQRFWVRATQVVDSREQPLNVWPGRRLVLVTCFPFDAIDPSGPLRYLVYAEPVSASETLRL